MLAKKFLSTVILILSIILTPAVVFSQQEENAAPEVNKQLLDERFIGHWVGDDPSNPVSFTFNEEGQWKFVFTGKRGSTQTNGGVWHVLDDNLMLWSYETEETNSLPFKFNGADHLILMGRELTRITPAEAAKQ